MVTSHWDSSVSIMVLIQFYLCYVLNKRHNTESLDSVRIKSQIIPMRSPFQTIRICLFWVLFFSTEFYTYGCAPGPRENEHVKTERGNFNQIVSYLSLSSYGGLALSSRFLFGATHGFENFDYTPT